MDAIFRLGGGRQSGVVKGGNRVSCLFWGELRGSGANFSRFGNAVACFGRERAWYWRERPTNSHLIAAGLPEGFRRREAVPGGVRHVVAGVKGRPGCRGRVEIEQLKAACHRAHLKWGSAACQTEGAVHTVLTQPQTHDPSRTPRPACSWRIREFPGGTALALGVLGEGNWGASRRGVGVSTIRER